MLCFFLKIKKINNILCDIFFIEFNFIFFTYFYSYFSTELRVKIVEAGPLLGEERRAHSGASTIGAAVTTDSGALALTTTAGATSVNADMTSSGGALSLAHSVRLGPDGLL